MILRFEDATYKKHVLNFYLNSGRIGVLHDHISNLGFGVFLLGNAKWKINVKEVLKLIRE